MVPFKLNPVFIKSPDGRLHEKKIYNQQVYFSRFWNLFDVLLRWKHLNKYSNRECFFSIVILVDLIISNTPCRNAFFVTNLSWSSNRYIPVVQSCFTLVQYNNSHWEQCVTANRFVKLISRIYMMHWVYKLQIQAMSHTKHGASLLVFFRNWYFNKLLNLKFYFLLNLILTLIFTAVERIAVFDLLKKTLRFHFYI